MRKEVPLTQKATLTQRSAHDAKGYPACLAGAGLQTASSAVVVVALLAAMLTGSYSDAILGCLTASRCALVAASWLFMREATGSWLPLPSAPSMSARTPSGLPEGRRDYGAACGLPIPVAEVHLLYSAAALALWPALQVMIGHFALSLCDNSALKPDSLCLSFLTCPVALQVWPD